MEIDTGHTAWLLVSTALVMFMTPGLALFYGGLVRNKNVLGTIMQSFFALGLVTIIWVVAGYTLAFAPGNKLIGGLDYLFLKGVGAAPGPYSDAIPHSLFMAFQMMFAVITPALITGAFAERMRFRGYVLFLGLWSVLVYSPIAHWVWGGGFIGKDIGALDFAGGTVVHINAGIAALAAALYLGKRKGYGKEAFHPHNVPMVVIGASILWFGWFGFNAGSALASNGVASAAFINTHIATAAAMLGWLAVEWGRNKAPTTIGAATGAVGGLVAITPAAGFVEPWAAIVIGLAAGAVCYAAVSLKPRLGYDDSLDVVGVHFVGGLIGALLTGVFATEVISGIEGANGLAYGNPGLLGAQALASVITIGYSFVMTLGILKVSDVLVGLRVEGAAEVTGLDLSEHAETAYTTLEGGSVAGSVPVSSPAPAPSSVAVKAEA